MFIEKFCIFSLTFVPGKKNPDFVHGPAWKPLNFKYLLSFPLYNILGA